MAAPLTLVRTGKPRGCELLSSLECECLSSGTALGFGFRKHTETDGKRQRGTDQGRRMACERRLSRDPQLVAWSQTHTCDTDCAGVSESVSDRLIGSKICPQQTLFQFGEKNVAKSSPELSSFERERVRKLSTVAYFLTVDIFFNFHRRTNFS